MATLQYLGAAQAGNNDLVSLGYVNALASPNLTQTAVNNLITTGFAPYVTSAYVNQQAALNATKAYVDGINATLLQTSMINTINGPVGLDATGRISPGQLNVASTQRFPKLFVSPSAYNASPVISPGSSGASGPTELLYTMSVADPGFVYKLLMFGQVDCSTTIDGFYPLINVNQGSQFGQPVGVGPGILDNYIAGNLSMFTTSGTYTIPPFTDRIDVILLGGGGGGSSSGSTGQPGTAGDVGHFSVFTIIMGTTIPLGTTTIDFTIGGGGPAGPGNGAISQPGGAGHTTSASAVSWTQTASGGAGGSGTFGGITGANAGSTTYNGSTYTAGAGLSPGHAGNGGAATFGPTNPGTAGQPGAAWFFSYPNSNTSPRGPASIIPWPLCAQSPISGSTTLYVNLAPYSTTHPSPTLTATTTQPSLIAFPVPA